MDSAYGPLLIVIYRVIDLSFVILSVILTASLISFAVEPLHPLYELLSKARFDNVDDKKFFIKHCIRIAFAMLILIVIRLTSITEFILVILGKVVLK